VSEPPRFLTSTEQGSLVAAWTGCDAAHRASLAREVLTQLQQDPVPPQFRRPLAEVETSVTEMLERAVRLLGGGESPELFATLGDLGRRKPAWTTEPATLERYAQAVRKALYLQGLSATEDERTAWAATVDLMCGAMNYGVRPGSARVGELLALLQLSGAALSIDVTLKGQRLGRLEVQRDSVFRAVTDRLGGQAALAELLDLPAGLTLMMRPLRDHGPVMGQLSDWINQARPVTVQGPQDPWLAPNTEPAEPDAGGLLLPAPGQIIYEWDDELPGEDLSVTPAGHAGSAPSRTADLSAPVGTPVSPSPAEPVLAPPTPPAPVLLGRGGAPIRTDQPRMTADMLADQKRAARLAEQHTRPSANEGDDDDDLDDRDGTDGTGRSRPGAFLSGLLRKRRDSH